MSFFSDDFDDLISGLKMDTDLNEVCLVKAVALVEIVNEHLGAPLGVRLVRLGVSRTLRTAGTGPAILILPLQRNEGADCAAPAGCGDQGPRGGGVVNASVPSRWSHEGNTR